jgi:glutaredoxin/glutathione-dependent peroxiredoxin
MFILEILLPSGIARKQTLGYYRTSHFTNWRLHMNVRAPTDRIPEVTVTRLGSDGMPSPVSTGDILGTGKVVLFAVPGAFTPGCSKLHLPGFLEQAGDLRARGVDTIACISVNDAWVMQAWAEAHGVGDDIVMLADGSGEFAKEMGLEMDGSAFGLGTRSKRYAAVVEDGVIQSLDVDEDGGVDVSSCSAVLGKL